LIVDGSIFPMLVRDPDSWLDLAGEALRFVGR